MSTRERGNPKPPGKGLSLLSKVKNNDRTLSESFRPRGTFDGVGRRGGEGRTRIGGGSRRRLNFRRITSTKREGENNNTA